MELSTSYNVENDFRTVPVKRVSHPDPSLEWAWTADVGVKIDAGEKVSTA
jgi:hypothetical protein